MISICSCCIDSYDETLLFLRSLKKHNPGVDYEVCIAVDSRDGGSVYEDLLVADETEGLNLVALEVTFDDSVIYLNRLIRMYELMGKFPASFRRYIRRSLDRYRNGTLFDPSKYFLWLSSGWL